ncbi:MAG: class I SAM-dependent methyltransferase [Anaerolineales bacterium]
MGLSKISRAKIQRFLRKTRLLFLADKINYFVKAWSLKKKNESFIQQNTDFILPPKYLAFDAYSAPDWEFYKTSGEKTARFIADLTNEFFNEDDPLTSIYEWGCGPGRVIRFLPAALGENVHIFGSDYNFETIEWCRNNIPGINFFVNELNPPLLQPEKKFDFIFAISVFTHLSETNCLEWAGELYRVLKVNGILLITTAGNDVPNAEMLEVEKGEYEARGVLVKGQYEEGKKMFLTRHAPHYVKDILLEKYDILKHVPGDFPFVKQDYWVARKRK